ncbi:MAG TPA: TlpA disulfide reductase family protein [Candidatus Polarisedimenticolaceae bacterium]|nr:TlpA disulfide reductase family protein [Candidatus Polarisedimenticolaceae bacterium]
MVILSLVAALSAILGQPVPAWPAKTEAQWVQGGPLDLESLRGRVVLVRFFTATECPYCSATAPALNAFHREFGPQGLVVIGMYTPKPRPRPTPVSEVREAVEAYGFTFPVAVDADWGALRALWLDRVPGASFTSASLLIDRTGRLRHVHEGGVFARDGDAQARQDYWKMREAIVAALAERP